MRWRSPFELPCLIFAALATCALHASEPLLLAPMMPFVFAGKTGPRKCAAWKAAPLGSDPVLLAKAGTRFRLIPRLLFH